jgi:Tfp pilus assembly protein PilV
VWGRRVLARVVHEESGVALIMALGTMLVLTIALTSTIYMTSASQRHAQISNAEQKASALAEAGINNAVAQLSTQYPSEHKEGTGGGVLTPGTTTNSTGTTSWSGTFDATSERWLLTGIGSVANPTGGSSIVRTTKAKIGLSLIATWTSYGLFTGDPTAACTDLKGGISVNVPVYVASCLNVGGNPGTAEAKIYESHTPASVTVQVGGQLSLSGGQTVGTSAHPVKWVSAGSCLPAPCGAASGEYALSYPSNAPIQMPSVDAQAIYNKALWSAATCTTGTQPFDDDSTQNGSKGNVGLFSLASYDCTAHDSLGGDVGRLAWNSSSSTVNGIPGKTLVIDGTIFIDGSLTTSPSEMLRYTGSGTIYFHGSVDLKGTICGPGSSFNVSTGACGMTWDPDQGGLLMVATNQGTTTTTTTTNTTLTFMDPNADSVVTGLQGNKWTKSSGLNGWSLIDDTVRYPTAPSTGTDRVYTSTNGDYQEAVFPDNTLVYDSTATYRVWIYGSAGAKRALDVQLSTNDGVSWGTLQSNVIPASTSAGWTGITFTVGSQTQLNQLRVRLICHTTASGGGAGNVEVDEVYVERTLTTTSTTTTTVLADPGFSVESGAKYEGGAWVIGNFKSTGTAELGGSVYVEDGSADIQGGGALKSFVRMPSGAPSLYGLGDSASEFG